MTIVWKYISISFHSIQRTAIEGSKSTYGYGESKLFAQSEVR